MSTINDFGIPGVGTGILQPKLKNAWRVTFANFAGGADTQPLSAQSIVITRPNISYEEVEVHRYNSKAWVQGKHTFDPVTLTVEDDLTGTASTVIQAQLQSQQFITGVEGPFLARTPEAAAFKFVTYLELLDGGEQVVEEWILEGCWLQAVDYTDLDYAASDAVQIQATIRYDHARQSVTGLFPGLGSALGPAGR